VDNAFAALHRDVFASPLNLHQPISLFALFAINRKLLLLRRNFNITIRLEVHQKKKRGSGRLQHL
jgi:hypothetical protein